MFQEKQIKMKKTLYAAVLFLTIGIAATSCTKEDKPKTKTETPAKTTLINKVTVDTGKIFNTGSWEFGQKFYASKNGNLTKLGCKMASKGNFRVSLWNFATTNLIVATTINVTDTLNFVYNNIAATPITANTRYVISINNTDGGINKPYYKYYKKPGLGDIAYPFSTGSITYESGLYSSSTLSVFPTSAGTDGFWGIPDMQFEYEE